MKTRWKTTMPKWQQLLIVGALIAGPQGAVAQDNMFAPGWTMNAQASTLRFQSVRDETIVETNSFGSFTGTIDETGLATMRVLLESVDTNLGIRDVRLRFMLFETYKFPEATITLQLDPAKLEDLRDIRRKNMTANYTIELHGISAEREAEITVVLLDDDTVAVTSATPISLAMADFDLDGGVRKLEETSKVDIVPTTKVSFDFMFKRAGSAAEYVFASSKKAQEAGLETGETEIAATLRIETCLTRLQALSETNDILFATGSAQLKDISNTSLDSVVEILESCPELSIRVGGHTDSDGSERANQDLSEARAQSVRSYLVDAGVEARRIKAVGFGETLPLVANDSSQNKQRNRRIEFTVIAETPQT